MRKGGMNGRWSTALVEQSGWSGIDGDALFSLIRTFCSDDSIMGPEATSILLGKECNNTHIILYVDYSWGLPIDLTLKKYIQDISKDHQS